MKLNKLIKLLTLSFLAVLTLTACGSLTGGAYISIVKDGNFYDYPDATIGEAFDEFFGSPSWEYFVSEENEDIVEFNGEAEYMGEVVDICIQFIVDKETQEFEVVWSDINEYEMSDADYFDLMDTVYGY